MVEDLDDDDDQLIDGHRAIPLSKAFGKKCCAYLVQEVERSNLSKCLGGFLVIAYYFFGPIMSLYAAARFFWVYNDFGLEHLLMFLIVFNLNVGQWYFHY